MEIEFDIGNAQKISLQSRWMSSGSWAMSRSASSSKSSRRWSFRFSPKSRGTPSGVTWSSSTRASPSTMPSHSFSTTLTWVYRLVRAATIPTKLQRPFLDRRRTSTTTSWRNDWPRWKWSVSECSSKCSELGAAFILIASHRFSDVSRHHKRKIWYGYEMKGNPPEYMTNREIQERIDQSFLVYQMQMEIRVECHDGMLFVSIKDKPKKRPIHRIMPTFFSLFPDKRYFFCSKKNVIKSTLKAVTEGLGYAAFKRIKIMGRDLQSLMQILWARQTGTMHGDNIKQPLVYVEKDPQYSWVASRLRWCAFGEYVIINHCSFL